MEDLEQKVIDKGRKLLALAERGFGGERDNAQVKLEAFLERNNISLDDLMSDVIQKLEFVILKKHQKLFFQIVWHTVPNWNGRYTERERDNKLWLQLTITQWTEICVLFDHYVKQYDREFKLMQKQFKTDFRKAFVAEAELYAHATNEPKSTGSSLGFDDLMRIGGLMSKLKVNKKRKELGQ
jgi:hypothetical protein